MSTSDSWGRFPRVEQRTRALAWRSDAVPQVEGSVLPHGLGRSYGDSCLNGGGTVLLTAGLDRLIDFDPTTGVVRCESGVSLDTLLRLAVPRGWFLPVTPGTKFVTVGGAIANDVHGKNHHRAGTFGRHVRRFELVRSDGSRRMCAPDENPDWFGATIGGLGLTGLVTWAEVQLKPIRNPFVIQETVPFENLDGFIRVSAESEADHDFTMSWVDCLARGRKLGRGLFYRGNFAPTQFERLPLSKSHLSHGSGLAVPIDLPGFCLNRLSVSAFNFLYYHRERMKPSPRLVHYDPFFYPLDSVYGWNRIYGRRGFLQFQCVVPHATARDALRELLERSARGGLPSFLSVLKTFGDLPSPGWLSFPRPGYTLALDFANQGEKTWKLVESLDRVTREAGGAVYPAKDARMSPESFAAYFPKREQFSAYVDPAFSSSFWRRVNPVSLPLPSLEDRQVAIP
ncbi:FAD-binding oxidoreductase [Corallococcus exiguus]|uniref:FAD-binding oxidoreductase n=1 Tax=Corallococcus TaxID=83461 RepID=UPI000F860565|nr:MULTISPECIES: FAD-binding oxidoreductase [Corallococcus]NNC15104.1 FAD-binding oxidoreductase [Corallococcus exiguus]NRD55594.1 FAD-binding oxidoreductase [Corallococcus exiguus]NRD66333.1 FAD-binding oxidoreductase [Corallococcus exiguus]RUO93618.1 FAD-binding oxidoreductase [Corallococcus sp. AB018]